MRVSSGLGCVSVVKAEVPRSLIHTEYRVHGPLQKTTLLLSVMQ